MCLINFTCSGETALTQHLGQRPYQMLFIGKISEDSIGLRCRLKTKSLDMIFGPGISGTRVILKQQLGRLRILREKEGEIELEKK